MFLNSIRWQIQIWHGLLLAVVVAALTAGFYHYERRVRLRELDTELQMVATPQLPRLAPPPRGPRGGEFGDGPKRGKRERAPSDEAGESEFEPPPRPDGDRPPGPFAGRIESGEFYYVVWSPEEEITRRSAAAPGDVPLPESGQFSRENPFRTRGKFREIVHQLPSGYTVLLGTSTGRVDSRMGRLAWQLAGAGLGVLALGLAGGWWLADRAIRPIGAISATAEEIARGKLSRRVNVQETESELGHLAAVLNNTFDQLEKNFEQQRRFTADASHELRTPLAVMLNEIQLARSRERSPEYYQQALETCERAAERMRKLVNSLLELARADSGDLELSLVQCDLGSVAREAIEFVTPLARKRHVTLSDTTESIPLMADSQKISQVLINLLTNAIQHNPEGISVSLSLKREDDRAVFRVRDTGAGILPEALPHIFERFYRADKSRARAKDVKGGTGLGLAICQAIVKAHRGAIRARSAPGKGSKFTVELPLGQSQST
jgi:two-component system OmpR family sensor kinase